MRGRVAGCDECSRRRKKVSECRPRGPGKKCWTCAKWVRECSFVKSYPPALAGLTFELSREEKQQQRSEKLRAIAIEKGIMGRSPQKEEPVSVGAPAPATAVEDGPSTKRPRTDADGQPYVLAAAVTNAAASALEGSVDNQFDFNEAASGIAPDDAAQLALMAWAAATAPSSRSEAGHLDLLAHTARRQGSMYVALLFDAPS